MSDDNDIYLEQAWVSAYSARYHNPSAHIVFVTDKEKHHGIYHDTGRHNVLKTVDEIIAIAFEGQVGKMERSRWLKTNLRNLVKGDFLFIDTDTVVAGNLSEIDQWDICLGAVLDLHCHFDSFPFAHGVRKTFKRAFGTNPHDGTDYFNSGVIYAKDTAETHHFFDAWHTNWQYGGSHGVLTDQPSLMKTCEDLPGLMLPISGDYNCQILGSIQYLHTARIMHFFNAKWNESTLCPFFGTEIYTSIKKNCYISSETTQLLLHCKEQFISPSVPVCCNDVEIWISPIFNTARWLRIHCGFLYHFINFASRCFLFLVNMKCYKKLTGGGKNTLVIQPPLRAAFFSINNNWGRDVA